MYEVTRVFAACSERKLRADRCNTSKVIAGGLTYSVNVEFHVQIEVKEGT